MSPQQRARYFTHLWPAACQAQGWRVKDEAKRREITLQATRQSSTTGLAQEDITALFALLGHLAGDAQATERWRRVEHVGSRAVNLQRQGEHFRKKAGYRKGGKADLQRFRKLGDEESAPEMTEEEAEKYLLTMRARANRKKEVADQTGDPF